MTTIYLVFKKKRVYTPQMHCTFQGIVDLSVACETKDVAKDYVKSSYEKSKTDFFEYKEAFTKGTVNWIDDEFKCIQETKDEVVEVTWEIKEVEVKNKMEDNSYMVK